MLITMVDVVLVSPVKVNSHRPSLHVTLSLGMVHMKLYVPSMFAVLLGDTLVSF